MADSLEKVAKWHIWKVTSPVTHIPSVPGIYAIGHDETIIGLEAKRVYVYIGQTNNLQRRFGEHSLKNEPLPYLRRYLRDHLRNAKIWYTAGVSKNSLINLERKLIRALNPKYNTLEKRA